MTTTATEILETEMTTRTTELATTLLESAQYTTTALYAIGEALRGMGDEMGADMIAGFAKRFAEYEPSSM